MEPDRPNMPSSFPVRKGRLPPLNVTTGPDGRITIPVLPPPLPPIPPKNQETAEAPQNEAPTAEPPADLQLQAEEPEPFQLRDIAPAVQDQLPVVKLQGAVPRPSAETRAQAEVTQLRRELGVKREPVSTTASDLVAFCQANAANDPLVSGWKGKKNPFAEEKRCGIL